MMGVPKIGSGLDRAIAGSRAGPSQAAESKPKLVQDLSRMLLKTPSRGERGHLAEISLRVEQWAGDEPDP